MKKYILTAMLVLLGASSPRAQVTGAAGGWADYNSNAFNDALGEGTLTLGAFLDLAADRPFGKSPISISADYSGSYSAYLSYFGRSHHDHRADALLVLDIGQRGYAAMGGAVGLQSNSPDRRYYNNNFLGGIWESKLYLADPVMLRLDGRAGKTVFSYFTDYDYNSFDVSGSISLFLPTKTAIIAKSSFRQKTYSSDNDSLAPQKIGHMNPAIRFTQSLGAGIGLAVEAGIQQNKVTADSFYMPDTLLREVTEYFDYTGNRLEGRLTVTAPGQLVFYAGYNNKDFTSLYAYQKTASDTSSPFTRAKSGQLRKDQTTELGVELTVNAMEDKDRSSNLILGGNYLINKSNDPYYDYFRFLFSATFEYNF